MNPRELFRQLEDPSTDHSTRLRCFWTIYHIETRRDSTKREVLFDIMKRFTDDILCTLGMRTYVEKLAFYNFAVQMFSEYPTLQNARILSRYVIKLGCEFRKNARERISEYQNRGINFDIILLDLRDE